MFLSCLHVIQRQWRQCTLLPFSLSLSLSLFLSVSLSSIPCLRKESQMDSGEAFWEESSLNRQDLGDVLVSKTEPDVSARIRWKNPPSSSWGEGGGSLTVEGSPRIPQGSDSAEEFQIWSSFRATVIGCDWAGIPSLARGILQGFFGILDRCPPLPVIRKFWSNPI